MARRLQPRQVLWSHCLYKCCLCWLNLGTQQCRSCIGVVTLITDSLSRQRLSSCMTMMRRMPIYGCRLCRSLQAMRSQMRSRSQQAMQHLYVYLTAIATAKLTMCAQLPSQRTAIASKVSRWRNCKVYSCFTHISSRSRWASSLVSSIVCF